MEQIQDLLFTLKIKIGLKDSDGSRIILVPVKERVTIVNVKISPDAVITPYPEV